MKKQNMILTSVFALVIASPAMAQVGDVITTGAQCTIGDLGVSSGTANATAQFTINSYTCAAGQYLPADAIACTTCPANNVCVGSEYSEDATDGEFTYNANSDQGITACSGEYTSSDVNSSSADSCYRECTTSDVAHSAAVTGRYYAGGATPNQCAPASTNGCVTGYHYVAAAAAPTLPLSDVKPEYESYRVKPHYSDKYGIQYCNSSGCGGESEFTASELAEFNDLSNGEWKISWTSGATQGTMHGIASCNSTAGDNGGRKWNNDSSNWLRSGDTFNSNSTGQYCWCKPTSWTPSGGAEQSLAAGWVFDYVVSGDASDCAYNCASSCASEVFYYADFRSALFGGVGATPAHCRANEISIQWGNGAGGTQQTTECTYDGAVIAPATQPEKRGHTFTGWAFGNTSQN